MAKYHCSKCNKDLEEINFYKYRDGSYTELCKKCLTLHVNVFDPTTYLWLLEKMDVPYVPEEWNILIEKKMAKDPKKPVSNSAVFGSYLSKMKLKQWKDYSWADTERLQAENQEKRAAREAETAELDAMYQEQFAAGQITEAQYKTLTSAASRNDKMATFLPVDPFIGNDNPYDETSFIDDADLPDPAAQLTQEDKVFLAMKWGKLYKPSEWVELERSYREMTESFDIQDADSKSTLVLLCKTTLKANQAIDCGDIDGFQKLSKVADSLRKSAKFTAAQNKEAKGDFVDSIGELIALCEREGFIPRFAADIPQDKVDMTLKDMNEYVRKLVTQDLGFGQQIEDSIKKIQLQKEMNEEAERRQAEEGDDFDPFAEEELSDADFVEHYDEMAGQIQSDSDLYALWNNEDGDK